MLQSHRAASVCRPRGSGNGLERNSLGDELEDVPRAVILSARLTHERPRQKVDPCETVIRVPPRCGVCADEPPAPVTASRATTIAARAQWGGLENFTGYYQHLVTAHLNQADRMLDPRAHARVLNKADRGLASDVPTIPLYQFVVIAAYDTSVRGFRFLPWNPLCNAEHLWLAE